MQHMVAVMLLDKTASFAAAHDKPRMKDAAILKERAKVELVPDEELERIQREHLAYLTGLREAGLVVTNGPVDGQPGSSLRGLAFYRTGSLERSRQLAEDDPAVLAGRLSVEITTWYCPPGGLSQPGRPVTLP